MDNLIVFINEEDETFTVLQSAELDSEAIARYEKESGYKYVSDLPSNETLNNNDEWVYDSGPLKVG